MLLALLCYFSILGAIEIDAQVFEYSPWRRWCKVTGSTHAPDQQ